MPISEHPQKGTILRCDFDEAFKVPEMVKPRPVVVISPKIMVGRPGLCTIVPLSETPPDPVMQYHIQINVTLPPPFSYTRPWVKGDMLYAAGFERLDFLRLGKDREGRRIYYTQTVSDEQLKDIQRCVLRSIGLSNLTKYL
jgi:uncharacterized protein YifN (PemK superfamily)